MTVIAGNRRTPCSLVSGDDRFSPVSLSDRKQGLRVWQPLHNGIKQFSRKQSWGGSITIRLKKHSLPCALSVIVVFAIRPLLFSSVAGADMYDDFGGQAGIDPTK
jgi:hypothetical protein